MYILEWDLSRHKDILARFGGSGDKNAQMVFVNCIGKPWWFESAVYKSKDRSIVTFDSFKRKFHQSQSSPEFGTQWFLLFPSFTLNTKINMPHEDSITALCFRGTDKSENTPPTLVTIGKDKRFKVWMLMADGDGESKLGWHNVYYYKRYNHIFIHFVEEKSY